MLISNEGDNDVFFDSVDCLLPPQQCLLTKQEFGYEIWVNEPMTSVKERRERFLQEMGLADASSKVCSQQKMLCCDFSLLDMGIERDCSGEVSNACILPVEQVHENLAVSEREATSDALVLFDDKAGDSFQGKVLEPSYSNQELRHREVEAVEEFQVIDMGKKKKKSWWKQFVNSRKEGGGKLMPKLTKGTNKTRKINVKHKKKRWMELSALYIGQEIRAHKGLIWTMKFSPNGQYLASGGEDGVVRIWRVSSLNTSSFCSSAEDRAVSEMKLDISSSRKKHPGQSSTVLPNKILKIDESPLQELYGHSSDVMDLAWSDSNILLSSSMDKTVRMWKIGCNQCLKVFRHKDYVTCIQFNPVDENYFISGSIDGKDRIWGILEERVVDWADIEMS